MLMQLPYSWTSHDHRSFLSSPEMVNDQKYPKATYNKNMFLLICFYWLRETQWWYEASPGSALFLVKSSTMGSLHVAATIGDVFPIFAANCWCVIDILAARLLTINVGIYNQSSKHFTNKDIKVVVVFVRSWHKASLTLEIYHMSMYLMVLQEDFMLIYRVPFSNSSVDASSLSTTYGFSISRGSSWRIIGWFSTIVENNTLRARGKRCRLPWSLILNICFHNITNIMIK